MNDSNALFSKLASRIRHGAGPLGAVSALSVSALSALPLLACSAQDEAHSHSSHASPPLELLTYVESESAAPGAKSFLRRLRGKFVRVNEGALSESPSREVVLSLPDGEQVKAHVERVDRRSWDDVTWQGTFSGNLSGHGVITLKSRHVAGRLWLDGKSYSLVPGPAGLHADLVEVDESQLPECGSDELDLSEAAAPTGNAVPFAGTSPAFDAPLVDVLVMYTPAALDAAGGLGAIEATAQSAVDLTNAAYENSNVTLRIHLTDVAQFDYDESGIELTDQLSDLRANTSVAAVRDDVGADLVALITANGAGYCGMGYVMRNVQPGFAPHGFSVTALSCAVSNLSFTHELGHNMGLEHDPANGASPAAASHPHSFGHFVNGHFRTVMSYSSQCTSGCARVPHFSNPDIFYAGFPTGIAAQRDNAQSLDLNAAVVAGFRTSCQPQCNGIECGADGCGGTCGTCSFGESCVSGVCEATCTPQCDGRECGLDGCGGNCGTCGAGESCVSGVCEATCTPQCGGRECGSDGCGGNCGTCAAGESCASGICEAACAPTCNGLECGDDGCGGSCGTCGAGEDCNAGTCESTSETACFGLPEWRAGIAYAGGDQVQHLGQSFECKPWPYSGWCQLGFGYEPGVGSAYTDAWVPLGACE